MHSSQSAPQAFPPTRISVVAALASANADDRHAAADLVARAYWAPVNAVLARQWRLDAADAADLTQEFFAAAFEKEWLVAYDPARGRFRTFLRTCVNRFANNATRAHQRLKRGGDQTVVGLDFAETAAVDSFDIDACFHDEWVRGVLSVALESLRAEANEAGRGTQVAVFEAYDVEDPPDDVRPTYRALGDRFGIAETQVTNYLAWARRAYRTHVLATLRALAGNEAEFREDARELLGTRVR